MGFDPKEFEAMQARTTAARRRAAAMKRGEQAPAATISTPPVSKRHLDPVEAVKRDRPRHQTGEMNSWESAFWKESVHPRLLAGELLWAYFETIKFRLANGSWYIPDFVCMNRDGFIEVWEVKGFWREDARLKIKFAASHIPGNEKAPIRWFAVRRIKKKDGGGWATEEIMP